MRKVSIRQTSLQPMKKNSVRAPQSSLPNPSFSNLKEAIPFPYNHTLNVSVRWFQLSTQPSLGSRGFCLLFENSGYTF